MNKLVRLKESFANFQSKLDMKQTKIISERNSEESKSNSKRKAPSKNISKQDIEIETRERDELGYAVSWKRAFKFIYKKATWIHSYADINKIAVDQIIKEFEDLIKSSLNDIQIEDSKRVFNDIQEFLKKINFYFKQSKEITIFRKSLVEFYADNFTKANLRKAKIELQEDISNINLKDLRVISFNLGAVITLGLIITFLVILFTGVDPEEGTTLHSISIWVFFPAFSFSFSLILILYLLSFCLYVWRKYNINYVYIFEIDPKFRLSEYQILKVIS